MIDSHGRNIEYLRLSVTERCELNCVYCREKGIDRQSRITEITPDEVRRAMRAFCALGIKKVRLTGGEPLMRDDIAELIAAVSDAGVEDICMTTNGQRLALFADGLKRAGLTRVNISLDSLQSDRYRELTRCGSIDNVFAGIEAAERAGLFPIKLNAVMVRGLNDDEVDGFIALTRDRAVDVRFIELMPIGEFGRDESHRVSNAYILAAHPELIRVESRDAAQPSEDYQMPGHMGRVGFISPISHRFCNSCNRVRLTADAKLIPCLGSRLEVPLRDAMKDEQALLSLIERSIFDKPEGHRFLEGGGAARSMDRIGG